MPSLRLSAFLTSLLLTAVSLPALADSNPKEILVTFGDQTLTVADFTAMLRGLPANLRSDAQKNPKFATQLLENLMISRTAAIDARQMGLDKNPEVEAEMRQAIDKVLTSRRIDALEAAIKFPDFTPAARERYEIDKAKYVEAEQLHAAHILIAPKDKTESGEAAAQKTAEEVLAKLKGGADFAALAAEYSSDPSNKDKGGDLGFFTRGRMIKPFEDAAFALKKPGELSGVVKTLFGYHIIKFVEYKPSRQLSFDEVKEALIKPMRDRSINDEKVRYAGKIKNDPGVKINTEALDRLLGANPADNPAAK